MNTNLTANIVHQVQLSQLQPDPDQPRRGFSQEELQQLADNIKARGILQPLVVRQEADQIIIKMGERRYRAALLAGLETVPCILDGHNGQDTVDRGLDQVAENEQRAPLNPMELATFLVRLRERDKLSVTELAKALEKHGMKHVSRPVISNLMRLVELPEWAQEKIRTGTWTASHGKYLLQAVDQPEVMEKVREYIKDEENWKGQHTTDELDDIVKDEIANAKWAKERETQQPILDEDGEAIADKPVSAKEEAAREKENAQRTAEGVKGRIEQYLEDFLRKQLVEKVLPAQTRDWLERLVLFTALGMPGRDSHDYYGRSMVGARLGGEQETAQKHTKRKALSDCLEKKRNVSAADWLAVALACAVSMTRGMVHQACIDRALDLGPIFRITSDYLDLQRRQQLESLAKAAKLGSVDGMTGAAIKAELLKKASIEAIGVPDAIVKLYKGPVSRETKKRGKS